MNYARSEAFPNKPVHLKEPDTNEAVLPDEVIDLTNEAERDEYKKGAAEQLRQVGVVIGDMNMSLSDQPEVLERFQKETKTPIFLLKQTHRQFEEASRQLEQALRENSDPDRFVAQLNKLHDEMQAQVEAINKVVSSVAPAEVLEAVSAAASSSEVPVEESSALIEPLILTPDKRIDISVSQDDPLPVSEATKAQAEQQQTETSPAADASPLSTLVFSADDFLTKDSYETHVRTKILGALMAAGIEGSEADRRLSKSLDNMDFASAAPAALLAETERIVANMQSEIADQRNDTLPAGEPTLSSSKEGESVVVKEEVIAPEHSTPALEQQPSWGQVSVLTKMGDEITSLRELLPAETDPSPVIKPLEEIRLLVRTLHEPDELVRRQALAKYQAQFEKIATELRSRLSEPVTPAPVVETPIPSASVEERAQPLILTPAMKITEEEVSGSAETPLEPLDRSRSLVVASQNEINESDTVPEDKTEIKIDTTTDLEASAIQDEINEHRFLSDEDRTTLTAMYENYERLRGSGRSKEELEQALADIRAQLEKPVDVAVLMKVAESTPFLSRTERMTIDAMYENYLRMKEEGKSEQMLEVMAGNIETMLEGPSDPSYLAERVKLVRNYLDGRSHEDGELLRTANAMYENYQRIAHPEDGSMPDEKKLSQAYGNLERFVLESFEIAGNETIEAKPESVEPDQRPVDRLHAMINDKRELARRDERPETTTAKRAGSWFKRNGGAVRKLGYAALLAGGIAGPSKIGVEANSAAFQPVTPDISTTIASPEVSEPTPIAPADVEKVSLDLNAPNFFEPRIYSAHATPPNPGPVPGVELPVGPETPPVEQGDDEQIYSSHATPPNPGPVPGVELPTEIPSPSIDQEAAAMAGEEHVVAREHQVRENDYLEKVVADYASSELEPLSPSERKIVFAQLRTAINGSQSLQEAINITSGNADVLFKDQIIHIEPLVEILEQKIAELHPTETAVAENEALISEGDKLFTVIDKKLEPKLREMPEFERQSIQADVREMLLELTPAEVKAMGIKSGNINKIAPNEKVDLESIFSLVEKKIEERWSQIESQQPTIEPIEPAQQAVAPEQESVPVAAEAVPIVVTDAVAEQYRLSYPGGDNAFWGDFERFIETVQGPDPQAGMLSRWFTPVNKANAYQEMKDVPVKEIDQVVAMPNQERLRVLNGHNIRVNDFTAWTDLWGRWKSSGLIKPLSPDTPFGEVIAKIFVAEKINNPTA